MEIRQTELLRYLGWKGQEFDETLQNKLEEAAKRCMELARPRCVVKKFAIGPDMRIAGDFALEGQDVAAHLAGCTELYLFAATVGADAEREISRLFAAGKGERRPAFRQRRDLRRRKLCGRDLRGSASGRNIRRPNAFPADTGIFPFPPQPKILRLLSADTKIGLCSDESFLLSPQKSVTALIGVTKQSAPEKKHGCGNKCGNCKHGGCAYRKE